MKKLLAIVLAVLMCLSLMLFVACNNDKKPDNPGEQTEQGGGTEEGNKDDGNKEEGNKEEGNTEEGNKDEGNTDDGKEEIIPEFVITTPENDGIVEMYANNVKEYLNATGDVNVSTYLNGSTGGYKGVKIKWSAKNINDISNYNVELSMNADYSDAEVKEASANAMSVTFDNLYKDTQYYARVTLLRESGESMVKEVSFKTTNIGPRPLTVDGIKNVRDLGGYKTDKGETTLQGLIYRGGSLSPTSDYPQYILSEYGKKYMSEVLNIKFDMDLRGNSEGGVDASPIPNAKIEWFGVNGYDSAFKPVYKSNYYNVFKTLSVKDNYPVYMHCTGGADRTGTVCFLLNALLGVSKEELIHDYEYTSFSPYGERNTKTGIYSTFFIPFLEQFEALEGATYSEKAENYMLGLGLSDTDVYNIRAIMTGKPVKVTLTPQDTFNTKSDEKFTIGITDKAVPEKVIINNTEVVFTAVEGGIEILKADMPADLSDGEINGKCVINGLDYAFTFKCSSLLITAGFDFSQGDITLDTQHNLLEGETLGYNGDMWQFKVGKETTDGNGKTHFFVGSYGVIFRGGCFRMATHENGGGYKELSPRVQFNRSSIGNTTLGFTFKENGNKVTMDLYIEGAKCFTYDFEKIANEIESANAKCTVFLGPETHSIVIKEK